MYEVIIIGGGIAGLTAAIYASRKRMKFLLITKESGGQFLESGEILGPLFSGMDIAVIGGGNSALEGVFAAGDCASGHEYQYTIAAGEGCMALLKAARYLANKR